MPSAPAGRKFGPPPKTYDQPNEAAFRAGVEQEFARMMRTNNAFPFLRLTSPNGTVWELTISDAGTATWTALT